MKIGIIDYGMGNLQSVINALNFLGIESFYSKDINELNKADKLILPGVGAFRDAIKALQNSKLDEFIKLQVSNNVPLLGICLGMQLLFDKSYEFGEYEGLGLLKGEIIKMDVPLKVPHMGWNRLNIIKESPLFNGLDKDPYVYFVHSYHLETKENIVTSTINYSKDIQVTAEKDLLFALQFHPEKSGDVGLKILDNFAKL